MCSWKMKLYVNFSDHYSVTENSWDRYYKAENLSYLNLIN